MSGTGAGYGQLRPEHTASEFNRMKFFFDQMMAQVWTTTPVKVVSVEGGGLGSLPTVSVQPMVRQVDGQGFATEHGIINGIRAVRQQGGKNAIINDPKVGDKGLMFTANRDVSAVVASGAVANPGSERMFDPSDSFYLGQFSADGEPEQYVMFNDDGMTVKDKNENIIATGPDGMTLTDKSGSVVDMKGGDLTFTPQSGTMKVNGEIRATGGISSNSGQHTLAEHVHSGVQPGSGNSGPPVDQ